MMAQPRLLQPEMYVGIHGGVVASMVQWSPAIGGSGKIQDKVLLSGTGGIAFRYSGHKCCGLQIELNYTERGWSEKGEGYHYSRKLSYLELPFMTHIWFGKPYFRGFINLGPEIGYCILDKGTGTTNPIGGKQYAALDHPFSWGITGGIGFYGRTARAGVFEFEARFNYQLGTLFSSGTKDYWNKANSMALSLRLAYYYEIKKRQ